MPRFTIVIDDLAQLSDEAIKARTHAVFQRLAMWLMRDVRDHARFSANFPAWAEALREAFHASQHSSHGIQAFAQLMHYIWYVAGGLRFHGFRAKIDKYLPEAKEAVMTIAEELLSQGREQGREKGRIEERADVVRKLLVVKFGAIGSELDAQINVATPEALDRYLARILTAETLAAVFDD